MKYLKATFFIHVLIGCIFSIRAQQSKNILPDMVMLPPAASYTILNTEPLVISQYFDTIESRWVNIRKVINERNSNADLTAYKVYDWIDSIWVNTNGFVNKLVYTNGKISEAVQSDVVQDFLMNANQYKYTYDANGKPLYGLISKDISPIFTGDYTPIGADSFLYVNGSLARRTVFEVIYDSILVPSSQVVLGYDSLARIISESFQNYDTDYEEWTDDLKRSYTYNPAGKLATYTKQVIQDNEWVNKENTTYVYAGNNLVEYTRFGVDTAFSFVPVVKYQYSYNGNQLSSITQSSYYDSLWYNDAKYELNYLNNKLSYSYAFEWNSNLNNWSTHPGLRLVYTESRTGLNNNMNNSFDNASIYPNPNNGTFSIQGIDYKSIKVFSMNGNLEYQSNVCALHNAIDLKPGLYFVQVDTDLGVIVKKMVISN